MQTVNESRAFAYAPEQGEARAWLGGLVIIKADGAQTEGRYALIEVHDSEGSEVPPHIHHREDEGFWILEGALSFQVGDQSIQAGPGTFLFGPKGVPHSYRVDKGPARLLFLVSPAGFEDFIRATSQPVEDASALPPMTPPTGEEFGQVIAAFREYGGDFLA